MKLAVIAFLLLVYFASGQVEILVLEISDNADYEFDGFSAANAFDDVNVSLAADEYGYEDPGAFDAYDLVVYINDQPSTADATQVAELMNFALAGGSVLLTGNTTFSGNDHLIDLLGGVVADGYGDCNIDDFANYDDIDLYSFSTASECAPLLSGGFIDIAGTYPSYDDYYNVFEETSNSECVTTLDTDTVSCLGNGNVFTARPVGSAGGAIYYLSSDVRYSPVQAGFYFVIYNNLLVHLGATPPDPSTFPATNVLVIGDYYGEDAFYYSSAFRTGGISTANVVVGYWETLENLDYGQYDMIVLASYDNEYSPRNENSYLYLQQYAAYGGVVLLTGYDARDDYTYYLLGADDIEDCSSFGSSGPYDLDPFPANEPLCDPLLNGGYRDMSGQDPDVLFPYSFGLEPNDDLDCPYLSGLLGTPCLTSADYSDELALWVVRHYGNRGGLIAVMPVDNNWGPYSFNLGFYRVALMNLMVYAGNQRTCSVDIPCVIQLTCSDENPCLISPAANDEWPLYYLTKIQWDPYHPHFLGAIAVNITLESGGVSVDIATNIPLMESRSSFDWTVYGIVPSTSAVLTFILNNNRAIVSDPFAIISPDGSACSDDGQACLDNIDCCSGNCQDGVCAESSGCLNDGALCAAFSPCCGTCNEAGTCGELDSCLLVDDACSIDSDCCSDFCNLGACASGFVCSGIGAVCTTDTDCCSALCETNICSINPNA